MKKLIISIILLLVSVISFFIGFSFKKETIKSSELNLNSSTPFLDLKSLRQHCPETNVSDDYVCIYKLAEQTVQQTDSLAKELIFESSKVDGAMSWDYIGDNFSKNLFENVTAIQKVNKEYFDAICNLDQMKIYGGSGADLEREACRYYYANQYLQILKALMPDKNKI